MKECPRAREMPAMHPRTLIAFEVPGWFADAFGSVYGGSFDAVTKPLQYRTFVLRAQSQRLLRAWNPAADEAVVFSAPTVPIRYCGHAFANQLLRDLGSTDPAPSCPCRNIFSRTDCEAYQALVTLYSPDRDLAHVFGEEAMAVFFEDVQAFFAK